MSSSRFQTKSLISWSSGADLEMRRARLLTRCWCLVGLVYSFRIWSSAIFPAGSGETWSIKVDAAYLDELIMRGLDGSVAYMVSLIVDNIL